jgi:hypothetical protein
MQKGLCTLVFWGTCVWLGIGCSIEWVIEVVVVGVQNSPGKGMAK